MFLTDERKRLPQTELRARAYLALHQGVPSPFS
jgi:hypothetical protein